VARDRDAALRALKEAVTVQTLRSILKEERGNAVLLALGFLVFLLAMGGIAIDVAYQMTAVGEAQRSMEAAALAGAGKLGFDNTAFPGARAAAVQYAALNPYHNAFGNLINLNLNTSNAPNGNIVLGVWDGAAFTPSLDGTVVNSVRCQWNSTVQTSFLRVLGIQTLPISAQAIAIANPPANPPPQGCMFPIGLSSCFFGGNTSLGCGATVSFISSSDQSAVGANTSAWVSMLPTCDTAGGGACANNVNTPSTSAAIDAAASGNCQASTLQAGTSQVESTNGMAAAVYNNHLIPKFIEKYNASGTLTVKKSDGSDSYVGKGWEVYVPVIQTPGGCPPGAINGALQVVGFTRFVITQVRNNNGECAVANHWQGNPWDPKCYTTKNGTATSLNPGETGSRGVYGYYDCTYWPSAPIPTPTPRTALATRLRIVNMY
jgi:Flp pilus assembly protein TadG